MKHILSCLISAGFAGLASAAGRTTAPSGCISVGKSGATYSTIQAAVNSLSTTSTAAQCIFIGAGTYNEQVLVSARSAALTIYGYTTDTSAYAGNKVTITASKSQKDGLSNDASATLRIKAANFKLYNVNVNNGYGEGSQAVALSAYADSGYYGCAFTGFQDTVLSNSGYQMYVKCLIQGATDFIFGQTAAAWFEKCDIRVLARSIGYITGTSYYVFNSCDVAAASGNSVPAGAYYLGRPWREYARVVFQRTALSAVVNPAGWRAWSDDDDTSHIEFGEYANTGTGAAGTRVAFARRLTAPVAVETVLGAAYKSRAFYDASYM